MLLCMHRTTLALDDALFRALKKKAAEEDRTLQELLNSLLRQAIQKPARQPCTFEMKTFGGEPQPGLHPGVDINDRDRLFDFMEGR